MAKVTAPLVGMHFRPPAKAILSVLPSACPLLVVPEPDNAYDANALQVFVPSAAIPQSQHSELDSAASLYGTSLAEILAQERWHLGYVKATEAVHLAPRINNLAAEPGRWTANEEGQPFVPATLSFDSAGKPLVAMDLPD
jgi:hypothetical protein